MNNNAKLFNALLHSIAPAHMRRLRNRSNKQPYVDAVILPLDLPAAPNSATPPTHAQLQDAHNARYIEEVRSSIC
jgi:hypothetical protein